MPHTVSYGRRLTDLAEQHPHRPAVIIATPGAAEESLSFLELEQRANRLARLFQQRGIGQSSVVALALKNSSAYFVASFATWKLGACVFPLRWDLPDWERERLLEVAKPHLLVGDLAPGATTVLSPNDFQQGDGLDSGPLPDVVAQPFRMNATGGSTGTPKIVVSRLPGIVNPEAPWGPIAKTLCLEPGQVQLVAGPLYHFGPSSNAIGGLLGGHTLVVLTGFEPAHTLEMIARYRVQIGMLVPTMLYRIMQLPDLANGDRASHHLASVVRLSIAGAKCPDWLLRKAIETFGADKIHTGYGGTENIGSTSVSGRDWLTHPGTVGRGNFTDIKILDDNGGELPTGEVGEIWMRHQGLATPLFEYRGGATTKLTEDSYASLGDLGWVDEEGYLYIADRRTDMFVSGGANVYPAEVEAALLEHPSVADVAVVGLPDDEWGARGHAILVLHGDRPPVDTEALKEHCHSRLARYKIPKSFEFVAGLPRDTLGKIRRSQLREERLHTVSSH
jgi:bile acid-coenzyme A ligase